jgi:hypothetical protein
MQPFKDLWRGHSPASRSIEARYTSLPPQLAVWRAIKSRHLLLAFICVICLLANALAVALGGLFNESPTYVVTPVRLKQTQSPTFSNASVTRLFKKVHAMSNPYQDNVRVIGANLSDGTALPAWLTNDYFFLPLELDADAPPETESYIVETTGFTAMPSCTHLDEAAHSPFSLSISGGQVNLSIAIDDNQPVQCSTTLQLTEIKATGSIALEDLPGMTASNDPTGQCNGIFLYWSRGTSLNGTLLAAANTSTYVFCQPRIASAVFNVTIDPHGGVRTADQLSNMTMYPMASGSTPGGQVLQIANGILHANLYSYWHNDTSPRNWVSYLMKLAGSTATDPHATLDPTTLVPQVESIYKRTLAALLQQNPQTFDDPDGAAPYASGTRRTIETRIYMPDLAFIISIAILCLDVMAALLIYWRSVGFSLPRSPTTIGAVIGYVAASPIAGWEWKYWRMGEVSKTYSLGNYTGTDDKVHLGIYNDAQ